MDTNPYESPKEKGSHRKARRWLVGIVVGLPAFYLLSDPPAFVLVKRGWISQDTYERFWRPIGWLYEHSPSWAQKPMNWYADMWN
jgi:hypothetical protein